MGAGGGDGDRGFDALLCPASPVEAFMSRPVVGVARTELVAEAILVMIRHRIF